MQSRVFNLIEELLNVNQIKTEVTEKSMLRVPKNKELTQYYGGMLDALKEEHKELLMRLEWEKRWETM